MDKDNKKMTVLVDTSFLITLYDKTRPNNPTAFKYLNYFLDNLIDMYLSTIVISEYQQMQPIVDIINSGNYIPISYNYEDAIKTAEIAYNISGEKRGSRAEFKDDLKLMGQAEFNNITFIITDDETTLAKYCERLSGAKMFKPKIIIMSKGFDSSIFNDGQASLIE